MKKNFFQDFPRPPWPPNMHFPTRPSNLAEIITFCINSSCQRYFCFFRIRVRVTVRVRVRVDRPAPNPVPQAPQAPPPQPPPPPPHQPPPPPPAPQHDGVNGTAAAGLAGPGAVSRLRPALEFFLFFIT